LILAAHGAAPEPNQQTMSSRPIRQDEDPAPPARQTAPPRAEQLIETHKAWIHAAAGMHSRHGRQKPRYFRPLAITSGIAVAAMLLLSLGRGGDTPRGTADFTGDLIPVLGADHGPRAGAKPVVQAFRGRKDRATEGRRGGGKAGGRSEQAARAEAKQADRPAEALREQRVPEAAPALTAAPATAPQVTDGRAAARPDSAGAAVGDAGSPRTAAAPDTQDP
jgi:hypothetical protein